MNFPAIQGIAGMDLADALQQSQIKNTSSGSGQHMKYVSATGEWSFGKENEIVTGELVTVITDSIQHGWHLWVDREVSKTMASFIENEPTPMANQEDRKGKVQQPSKARSFECVLDDEDGVQIMWETSSVGGTSAIDEMMNAVRARAMTDRDFLYPVVKLGSKTAYENPHKAGDMITPPDLEIVGWRNREGEDAPDEMAKIEAKPADDEPAEETADAAPSRRRRRSAG